MRAAHASKFKAHVREIRKSVLQGGPACSRGWSGFSVDPARSRERPLDRMAHCGHISPSRSDLHSGERYSFPVPDNTYDVVVAANVLEHVRKVWVWIRELSRVCQPGGYVITVNPVSWPYHAIPIDCWRAYPEGMRALYDEGGLKVIVSEWEALADPHVRKSVPGRSQTALNQHEGWKTKAINRALLAVGYPVERAFDIVTIGQKLT